MSVPQYNRYTAKELSDKVKEEREKLIAKIPDPEFKIGDVIIARHEEQIYQFVCARAFTRNFRWTYIWGDGAGFFTTGEFDFDILKKLK